MDFDDFDAEDAAILGGIIGFAEESIRDEEEYLRGEPLREDEPGDQDWVDTSGNDWDTQLAEAYLSGLSPEMRETVLRSVVRNKLAVRLKRKEQESAKRLLTASKRIQKEFSERGSPTMKAQHEYLSALIDYRGSPSERDYERYPDLFFIEEALGQGWELEFDYTSLMGDRVEGLVGTVRRIAKDGGKIYLVVEPKDGGLEELIPMETLEWLGTPGQERTDKVCERKAPLTEKPEQDKAKLTENARSFANRIELEFGIETFVDDIEALFGNDRPVAHLFIGARQKSRVEHELALFLARQGYEEKKTGRVGVRAWKSPGKKPFWIILHGDQIQFNRRKNRYEQVRTLFRKHPDYVILAKKIAESGNRGLVREIFLSLACNDRFRSHSYAREMRNVKPPEIAMQIEEICGAETLVDHLPEEIENLDPLVYVYTETKEQIQCVRKMLKGNGYCVAENDQADDHPLEAWVNPEQPLVVIYFHPDLYQEKMAESIELTRLFAQKPDYMLIAMAIKETEKVSWRKIFKQVLSDPDMIEYLER